MQRQLFIILISFILFPVLGSAQTENIKFSFNIKNNFQTSYLNSIVESKANIIPTISFRVKDSNIIDNVNFYLGFDYKNIKISGTTDISIDGESVDGKVKGSIGGFSSIFGIRYFLTNNDTRPYINAHYRLYMPKIKSISDGDVDIDGDSYSWDTGSVNKVLRNIVGINSKELGFGVEHKINDNLAIFGEYNINSFKIKLKVSDVEDFIDDVNDALEDSFGDIVDIDPIDEEDLDGSGKAKIKYNSSYASLGISFYF